MKKRIVDIRSTTILGVRLKGQVAVAGDGQVTLGDMAMKQKAVKVRKFNSSKGGVVGGFAGAAADALTLFEKFEQIKYAGGGHQSGTGLGLSLTRELVEIHGGCLWLERAALGVGAVFMLWLPDGSLNTSAEIQA